MDSTGKTTPALGIGQMSELAQRWSHHRRTHSDDTFLLSDFNNVLRFDPFDVDIGNFPPPLSDSPNDAAATAAAALGAPKAIHSISEESIGRNSRPSGLPVSPSGHLRRFSMDYDFDGGLGLNNVNGVDGENDVAGEWPVVHGRRSISKDRLTAVSVEADSSAGNERVRKAMTAEKLAELALVDPKKAQRILANRQSAARSKERRSRYATEMQMNVQTLQIKSTNLSAQLTMLQRDITGLSTENKELKMRLETMHQQSRLRDALNESMKEELRLLNTQASLNASFSGNTSISWLVSQFASQLALHQLANNQSQQTQPQPMLDMRPSSSKQPFNGKPDPDFLYFNKQN